MMMEKFLFVLIGFLVIIQNASAQGTLSPSRKAEQDLLDALLGRDYDSRVNPGGNSTQNLPTVVTVNMYVRQIRDLSTSDMEYSVQLTLRVQWVDNRLVYKMPRSSPDLKYLSVYEPAKLWTPDLFVSNEIEAKIHDFMHPNRYLRIFPNGEVLQSQRVSLSLTCPMILKLFPFDKQVCSMRMASYGSTTRDIIFKWKELDPIQVTSELHLPSFHLEQFTTDYCDSQTITGVYSCLRLDFLFSRDASVYLVRLFIPTTMLVILAWFAFWLDTKSSLVARIAIVLCALSLIVILVHWVSQAYPPISYTMLIDVWTGICITFVFTAVAETIVSYYLSRRRSCGHCPQNVGACGEEACPKTQSAAGDEEGQNIKGRVGKYWQSIGDCGQKLDFLFRIIYPLAFFIFLLSYCSNLNPQTEDP